jgi:hypothetical protein
MASSLVMIESAAPTPLAGSYIEVSLKGSIIDIATFGTAKVYVFSQQKLFVSASGATYVYYKGNPTTKSVEISGTSKVIQE